MIARQRSLLGTGYSKLPQARRFITFIDGEHDHMTGVWHMPNLFAQPATRAKRNFLLHHRFQFTKSFPTIHTATRPFQIRSEASSMI